MNMSNINDDKPNQAERISRLMVKLNLALVDVVKDDNLRREISFNLSDIREEVALVNHIFEEVEVNESITDSQFEDLSYILCTHWSYHIEELKPLILQLERQGQPLTSENSRVTH